MQEHINRLSETIKNSKGKSVLILSPEEIGFLTYLNEAGVSTSEFKISWNKIKNIQLSVILTFYIKMKFVFLIFQILFI